MCSKENRKLEIRNGDVKITVEGQSEVFGGNDLKLKAIHALINNFDFTFEEKQNCSIRDLYIVAIVTSLGKFIMNYDPPEILPPGALDTTPLKFVREYIDWCLNDDYEDDSYVNQFIEKHVS